MFVIGFGASWGPVVWVLLGEMFPADPVAIGMILEPLGLAPGPVVPTREWRELYAALDCAVVGAIHPFYTASVREFETAGRKVVGSAPVGRDGTAAWLDAIGSACGAGAAAGARPLVDALHFVPGLAQPHETPPASSRMGASSGRSSTPR